jgi:hypothetical protein
MQRIGGHNLIACGWSVSVYPLPSDNNPKAPSPIRDYSRSRRRQRSGEQAFKLYILEKWNQEKLFRPGRGNKRKRWNVPAVAWEAFHESFQPGTRPVLIHFFKTANRQSLEKNSARADIAEKLSLDKADFCVINRPIVTGPLFIPDKNSFVIP